MKPKILIIYYSQTGQTKRIATELFKDSEHLFEIEYEEIRPLKPFPFPWNSYAFFDCMPETVLMEPCTLNLPSLMDKHYDIVIIAYQPWFLSPSLPVSSFLQLPEVKKFLINKKVITLIGCRNMWINAQEKMKQLLITSNAQLIGNIVLEDKSPNLISVLTIMRWMFKGQKEASGLLPVAGIREYEFNNLKRFQPIIHRAVTTSNYTHLQNDIIANNGVTIKPSLILLEKRGNKSFNFFARFIKQKGNMGDIQRKPRVILYKYLLIIILFILSPISSLIAKIVSIINKKSLNTEIKYFQHVSAK